MPNEIQTIGNPNITNTDSSSSFGSILVWLLFAMPQDKHWLNETFYIIQHDIKVFTITETDINASALGWKRTIKIIQVGLVYLYAVLPIIPKRMPRAGSCQDQASLPSWIKSKLHEIHVRSVCSTEMMVQYFIQSTKEKGMIYVDDVVFID